jgi:hypothetical protein
MDKRLIFSLAVILLIFNEGFSQEKTDSTKRSKEEKVKTGWTFGAVPAIAYDTDVGFKYGGLVNLYHYGDGSTYPQYMHSIYLEWSRTTKGSGINQFLYDSEYLIPNIRVTLEASLLTEKALDFYGFNGREVLYKPAFEDVGSPEYISRLYYRHDRSLARFKADFQGPIIGRKLRWLGGLVYYGVDVDTVDVDALNEGKKDDLLPDIPGLYENYVDWGVIPDQHVGGGDHLFVKGGVVYDTRDNEPNPQKGIWTEALIMYTPSFDGNATFAKLALNHRQYFTLYPGRLSLAYRLSYQPKLFGDKMPFYMMPFVFDSKLARDGVGGKKTVRGILRNRLVGEDYLFGNLELRWKMYKTVILNQNFYLALSGFLDGGMVTGKYPVPSKQTLLDNGMTESQYNNHFNEENESLHVSYGAGLHFVLNENFIVAVDYGLANKPNDGDSGFYIGMDFLF